MRSLITILVALGVLAALAVEDHTATTTTTEPTSAEVMMTNAYDAFGPESAGLTHDFGFSSVVQYKGKMILFDAGTNAEVFQRHLKSLGIDPKKIDIAIVSHGHYDHIGGFDYLLSVNPNVKIYLPNDFFSLGAPIRFPFREPEPDIAKQLPKEQLYYRGERAVDNVRSSGRFWKARVEYVTEAKEVLPGVTLIPTTSKLMGTFIKYPPFDEHPQLIGMPELTVSFATARGEVLLAGCSHSTIEAIIQEAQKILKRNIHLVAGGFHLIPYDREYIEGLAKRMQDQYGVESVAPAHCTGHLAFAIFRKVFGDKYRFFGLGERISL
jgi:7,8-dihydropterin-6-yl-methyl-4-(beta-D-ribofuranosyl)aminobenzene 5'-phosphate synthase